MRRTWSIRRRQRRRGGGRRGWKKVFEAEDSKGWGRAMRLITRLQREHVRYYHDFLLSLFLSHFGTIFRTRLGNGNFLRSGTSTYQRSCKINFFTITHCSTRASNRGVCSFALGENWLSRLLADTTSQKSEYLIRKLSPTLRRIRTPLLVK
jgi:hypothetical protein